MLTVQERQQIQYLLESQVKAKDRLKRLKKFTGGRDSVFWKALCEEIKFSIEAKEFDKERRERARPQEDPVKDWGYNLADRSAMDAYNGIIDVVEKSEVRLDSTNMKIGEYSRTIKEIEQRAEHRVVKSREEV